MKCAAHFFLATAIALCSSPTRAQGNISSIGKNDDRTALEKTQSIERAQKGIGILAEQGARRGGIASAFEPFMKGNNIARSLFDAGKDAVADAAKTMASPELAALQQVIKNDDLTIEPERLQKLICANNPLNPSCLPPPRPDIAPRSPFGRCPAPPAAAPLTCRPLVTNESAVVNNPLQNHVLECSENTSRAMGHETFAPVTDKILARYTCSAIGANIAAKFLGYVRRSEKLFEGWRYFQPCVPCQ